MGCTGSTTISRRTPFISRLKPRRFLAVRPELRRIGFPRVRRVCRLWRCPGEPDALRGYPAFAAGFGMGFSQRLTRTERQLFPPKGVGRTRNARSGILLSGTPADFYAKPSSVFRGARANRHVSDRRAGHPNDLGLPEARSRVAPLLHLRQHVSRQSGCPRGASRGGNL